MLSLSRVRQYETIKIRENIELIMTTCIHRHLCTHIDIYLRYCYVTIMSFLNATAKSNTFVRSYSKGKWYTQGNHCLLPIFSYYRLIINRTSMQINLYIIFPRLVIWNETIYMFYCPITLQNYNTIHNNTLIRYEKKVKITQHHLQPLK